MAERVMTSYNKAFVTHEFEFIRNIWNQPLWGNISIPSPEITLPRSFPLHFISVPGHFDCSSISQ